MLFGAAAGAILAGGVTFGPRWLRLPVKWYVDFIRGIPVLLVIFWLYFLLPVLLGRPVNAMVAAVTAFALIEAAYACEIFRSGMASVPTGQWTAGLALGMSPATTFQKIILPQAFTNARPILVTQVIILFQDTSLVYVLALQDFFTAASIVAQRDFKVVEVYLFVALVYMVICISGSLLVRRMKINRRKS